MQNKNKSHTFVASLHTKSYAMTILRKITIEKALRYLFLLLSIGAGLMLLLNLSAYLGIGGDEAIIRGTQLQQEQDLTI